MSWSVTTYYCETCNYEAGDLHTWGTREYQLPSGVRISMDWTLGWCTSCNGIRPVEILDAQAKSDELALAEKDLQALGHRPGPRATAQSIANWNYLAGLVEDARDALNVVTIRERPIHCLKCGSDHILPWQTKSDAPMVPIHQPCGNPLLAREDGLRFALKPTISRYTTEGDFIEQVDVPGYSMPDFDYFSARQEENARIRGLWTSTKPNVSPTLREDAPRF